MSLLCHLFCVIVINDKGSRKIECGFFFYTQVQVGEQMRMTDKNYNKSKCSKCEHKIKVNEQVIYCPFINCIKLRDKDVK